ncbi:MAG: glycosyltransferase family 39 protein [Planctomycetota bacterium]|nr:glycosyltransferase family 39 protein [Planctomycetota bacterium]
MSAIDSALVNDQASREAQPLRWSDYLLSILDRWRKPAFVALLIIYLAGFNGQWQIEPDSALYLVLGRNIALGRGYTYHDQPHALALPGLPYALAGIFHFFGSNALFVANGFILLCGLAALGLTYRLVLLAFDRPRAVVITLGVGLSHEFFRYCYEIMTDVPAMLGVMAFLAGHEAIFGQEKAASNRRPRAWDWALLIVGLAVAASTRPTTIGLIIAWIISLLWTSLRRPGRWRLSLIALGTVAGVLVIFLLLDPRRSASRSSLESYEKVAVYQLTHDLIPRLHTVIQENVHDLFSLTAARAVFGMPLGMGWLNAIFGTVVLVGGVALIRRQPLWGLWVAMNIVMLVLFVSHDRYIVQILPLLVIGWWLTIEGVARRFPPNLGNSIFALLLVLGIVPNTVQCIGVILRQHDRPFLAHYKEGRFPSYLVMANEIRRISTLQDKTLCPQKYGRILTYFSHRNVYEENEPLGAAGGRIFVVLDPDDNELKRWLASINVVTVGPPLLSVPRSGSAGKSPLLLLNAASVVRSP